MDEKKIAQTRGKKDLSVLDSLPENIEDIEADPILKPLIEFHKQATMLEKEDKMEANFLKEINDEIDEDLKKGIYDNSYIVKKYKNMKKEYERLILIYSRYTDLSDEKIVEMKGIVEKYYMTKKEHDKIITALKEEIEKLKKKQMPNEDQEKIVKVIKEKVEKATPEELEESKKYLESQGKKLVSMEEEKEEDYEQFLKRKKVKK